MAKTVDPRTGLVRKEGKIKRAAKAKPKGKAKTKAKGSGVIARNADAVPGSNADAAADAAKAVSSRKSALYTEGDMILLVGEGNLSFSCGLLQKLGSKAYIVATVHDSQKVMRTKYPDARNNLKRLTTAGMQVRFGIDCKELHRHDDFRDAFTKIIFNFPHSGTDLGESESIKEHQQLLQEFFKSAAECLEPVPTSEVHVTMKAGQPYISWRIEQMAKLSGKLRCDRVLNFNAKLYPGYEHRRTRGDKYAAARGFNENNVLQGAKTYVFKLKKEGASEKRLPSEDEDEDEE